MAQNGEMAPGEDTEKLLEIYKKDAEEKDEYANLTPDEKTAWLRFVLMLSSFRRSAALHHSRSRASRFSCVRVVVYALLCEFACTHLRLFVHLHAACSRLQFVLHRKEQKERKGKTN